MPDEIGNWVSPTHCIICVFVQGYVEYFNVVGTYDTFGDANRMLADFRARDPDGDFRVEYRRPETGTNLY
jgi:hypothetical protein